MTQSLAALKAFLDARLPITDIFHVAFLSDAIVSGAIVWSTSTDSFSGTPAPPVGSRIRLSATTLPAGASDTIDYYMLPGEQLALTLSGAPVSFASSGTDVVLTEQEVNANDPMSVLISKELTAYATRSAATSTSAIIDIGTQSAIKTFVSASITAGLTAYSYKHILLIQNGTSSSGNTSGTVADMRTSLTVDTISIGQTKTVTPSFVISQL